MLGAHGPGSLPHVGSSWIRDQSCVYCFSPVNLLLQWSLNLGLGKVLAGISWFSFTTELLSWASITSPRDSAKVVAVQLPSRVQPFVISWTAACQASLSSSVSRSLLRIMSIESVMPSNRLILCHPLLLPPSIFPSIRVFSNDSALPIRWPKYWSFSFSISPSNEYSGLISFRMNWLDLLAVQETLESFPHHSPLCSGFFMICKSTGPAKSRAQMLLE